MQKVKKSQPGLLAIVGAGTASSWISCRTIVPNLVRAYQTAFGKDLNYFSLTNGMIWPEICQLARRIHASKPERIVFVDHQPHPIILIRALKHYYGARPLPPIFVHVFGDFTYLAREWYALSPVLHSMKVRFICASDRQHALLSRLLGDSLVHLLEKCPFPVDVSNYTYDPLLRDRWRTRLGLEKSEIAVLYTGRISLQKNLLRLTDEVSKFAETVGKPVRFYVAGPQDDLGAPFFGLHLRRGYYYQAWVSSIAKLDPVLRDRVQYLGQLEPESLAGLYNAADIFASLSLHHDEDFGMSPAEALCCGSPVVLSDWGGYASFHDGTASCQIAPVHITKMGLYICSEVVQHGLLAAAGSDVQTSDRQQRAREYQKRFSVAAAAKRIAEIHGRKSAPFTGFGWRMQKYAEALNQVPFPSGPSKNTFYEEIYGAYASARH